MVFKPLKEQKLKNHRSSERVHQRDSSQKALRINRIDNTSLKTEKKIRTWIKWLSAIYTTEMPKNKS